MTAEVEKRPSQDELIARLDPERDYGERTFEQVINQVGDGRLFLEPGANLPVIKDTASGRMVRGSGRVPGGTQGPRQHAMAEFYRLALDDLPEAYRYLWKGIQTGDYHFLDIYFKNVMPKQPEVRGGDEMGKAFQMMIERMAQPEQRTVEIIDQS